MSETPPAGFGAPAPASSSSWFGSPSFGEPFQQDNVRAFPLMTPCSKPSELGPADQSLFFGGLGAPAGPASTRQTKALFKGSGVAESALNFAHLLQPISSASGAACTSLEFVDIFRHYLVPKLSHEDALSFRSVCRQFCAIASTPYLPRVFVNAERILEHFDDWKYMSMRTSSLKVDKMMRGPSFALLTQSLQSNASITSLSLAYNSGGDANARLLAEVLQVNSAIENLQLECADIEDSGMEALSGALKVNKTVKKLAMRHNFVGDNGATAFAEALKSNTTLEEVNLAENLINTAGALALAQALESRDSGLKSLNLSENKLGPESAAPFARALKKNTCLVQLNLSETQIDAAGGKLIAEALHTNTTLRNLSLTNNSLQEEGLLALAKMITINSSLQDLEIYGVRSTPTSWTIFCSALAQSSLRSLKLTQNDLGDEAIANLARSLTENTHLRDLELMRVKMSDAAAKSLARALRTNTTLQQLHLEFNLFGSDAIVELASALSVNRGLTYLGLNAVEAGAPLSALLSALQCNETLHRISVQRQVYSPAEFISKNIHLHTN